MFLNRSRKDTDSHLEWKVRVFAVGAGLALAGMFTGMDWLVTVALVVLVGGVGILVILGRRAAGSVPEESLQGEGGAADDPTPRADEPQD